MRTRARLWRLSALALAGLWVASARADPAALNDRTSREWELRGVETNLKTSDEERRRIESDVEAMKLDRARLTDALLETTARLQKIETDRSATTDRLAKASADAAALQASYDERRDRLAELLAGLQRMTRNAPPALFVRPDDMAAAVRAAGVVSGLIADIKGESDALSRDLGRMSSLKVEIAKERSSLDASAEDLAVDKARLDALVEARQKALGDRQAALDEERKRADQLANQAGNLRDLISKMNGDAEAAAAADRAAAASRVGAHGDVARLKPAIAFSDARGRLSLPVAGAQMKGFGDPDGYGGQTKGVSVATPSGATVSTPIDAWIAFAGPYRSYGQLLILNAGEGYYLVLAGMERIQVSVGQFVLAGEPVATMRSGATRAASAAAIGADPPVLYIELRKNDTVIDPQPWWVKPNLEKARG